LFIGVHVAVDIKPSRAMCDADEMGAAAASTKTSPGVPPPALAVADLSTIPNSTPVGSSYVFQKCSSVRALLFSFATSLLDILLVGDDDGGESSAHGR
jgi:hypothetical protein